MMAIETADPHHKRRRPDDRPGNLQGNGKFKKTRFADTAYRQMTWTVRIEDTFLEPIGQPKKTELNRDQHQGEGPGYQEPG